MVLKIVIQKKNEQYIQTGRQTDRQAGRHSGSSRFGPNRVLSVRMKLQTSLHLFTKGNCEALS